MTKKNEPYRVEVEKDNTYFWCRCGESKKQPFCDGSHAGSPYSPVKFFANKAETLFFCGCKATSNQPFCDGTHNTLKPLKHSSLGFNAFVEPDGKQIEVSEDESILLASLRSNISHLSACGGVGKCSTCRIEVLKGLEHCSERSALEATLAKRLSLPDNIRLACQTKVKGEISFRRLLLDKRDVNLNNQLIDKKLESVGTIRNLTIMFCDIKGFTPFSEALSAYDVIFILNRYFSIMREIIVKNGGEINNYIGDAMLAIFGLKESQQQALRAVSSAIQMIKAMDNFKDYLRKAYGQDFDLRIGVHYGEVIVGTVGFEEDKKLTVIGDTVNIASRIEATNKESETRLLISDVVYEQVKDFVSSKDFVRLKLRGSSNLITLHEISEVVDNSIQFQNTSNKKNVGDEVWIRGLPLDELLSGEKKKFEYDDREILLINQGGIFAIENVCPHMNLPLDMSQITEQGTIMCPYHNSEFCFKSGEVRRWVGELPDENTKDCKPLNVIETRSEESYIWIKK